MRFFFQPPGAARADDLKAVGAGRFFAGGTEELPRGAIRPFQVDRTLSSTQVMMKTPYLQKPRTAWA